jgi:hypothetical protein
MVRLISFGLTDGGTAGLIYGFIVCIVGFSMVYLSISEMASMLALLLHSLPMQLLTLLDRAPTSGGRKLIFLSLDFFPSVVSHIRNYPKAQRNKGSRKVPCTLRFDVNSISLLSKSCTFCLPVHVLINQEYHWVSEFAPPGAQKYLSYISGNAVYSHMCRERAYQF